jgi:hypothetical protein
MPVASKKRYQALVCLSVGRVERTQWGRDETSERVMKGEFVELTEKEAANFGRFVRPADEADKPFPQYRAKHLVEGANAARPAYPADREPTLEGSGALDITNKTEEITSSAELPLDDEIPAFSKK